MTDTLSTPATISFVDFDGDCKQDLLLTRSDGSSFYYEIFVQTTVNNEPRYYLTTKSTFGLGLSSKPPIIDIVDFNRDGMMDIMYPRIKNGKNSAADIVVMFNRLPAKGSKSKNLCQAKPTINKQIFYSEPNLISTNTQVSDWYL